MMTFRRLVLVNWSSNEEGVLIMKQYFLNFLSVGYMMTLPINTKYNANKMVIRYFNSFLQSHKNRDKSKIQSNKMMVLVKIITVFAETYVLTQSGSFQCEIWKLLQDIQVAYEKGDSEFILNLNCVFDQHIIWVNNHKQKMDDIWTNLNIQGIKDKLIEHFKDFDWSKVLRLGGQSRTIDWLASESSWRTHWLTFENNIGITNELDHLRISNKKRHPYAYCLAW
jgi:hypothetical protein